MVDQRPQTQVLHWQNLFSAALDLLQECEREWNAAEEGVRENIQIGLEYLIAALQQVVPFISINSVVLNEILGNIHLLHRQCIRLDSNCTNLAVFSLNRPEVFRSGSVGRPRYLIWEEVLHLRPSGFTGTAMGTKTAVPFANIFMAKTETLSKVVSKPTVLKRYIDDVFSLWDMSKPDIETSSTKQICITLRLNSRQKYLTLKLCF